MIDIMVIISKINNLRNQAFTKPQEKKTEKRLVYKAGYLLHII